MYPTKSLSLQRFGEYISPHVSCRIVFDIHFSTLDGIIHEEVFNIHMFCPLVTGSFAIQHESHVTLVVLEHDVLCHIVALRLHEVQSVK